MAQPARAREARRAAEPFGASQRPVLALAVVMIAALAAPAFGPLATLVQLLALGGIAALRWRDLPPLLPMAIPLLLLGAFAAASALWSDVPGVSLRYGVQLMVTAMMGVLLGRLLSLRDLALAVFVALSIACLLGLASGRMGVSEDGPVLIGLSGSKNQMGYIALFWLSAALCIAGSGAYRLWQRAAAALAAAPAVYLIAQVASATALVSMVALVGVLGLLALAALLGRGGRLFALAAAALLAIPAALALPIIERQLALVQTDVLQKDARLTGRTLLWEEADRLIRQAPIVGHGYKAIWLGPKGKGLLARNKQRDGRAFHFHDTMRELTVDLGVVGLALFLLPLAYATVRGVLLLIVAVDAQRAFAFASLFTILLRLRTELVVGPFLIDTVLLTAIIAALAAMPLGLAARAPRGPRNPRIRPMRGRPRSRSRRPSSQPQRNLA